MKTCLARLGLAVLGVATAATPVRAQVLGFGLSVTPSAQSVLASNAVAYTINVTNRTGLTASDLWITNSFSTQVSIENAVFTLGNSNSYVNVIATFHVGKNADLYIGGQYMPLGNANFGANGRNAELKLNGQLNLMAGISWPF